MNTMGSYTIDACFWRPDNTIYYDPAGLLYSSLQESLDVVLPAKDVTPFKPGTFKITARNLSRAAYLAGMCSLRYTTHYNATFNRITYDVTGTIGNVLTPKTSLEMTEANLSGRKMILLQKSYAKVGSAKLPLGEDIGEIHETLSFIRHPFKDFRDFFFKPQYWQVKTTKKGVEKLVPWSKADVLWNSETRLGDRAALRFMKEHLNVGANTWMELRYALRPLVISIMKIIAEVEEKASRLTFDSSRIRSTKATWSTENEKVLPTRVVQYGPTGVSATTWSTSNEEISLVAKTYYQLLYPRTKAQYFGLSPEYLPETLWALTSRSFVLDWVFSVGQWLSSLRVNPSINLLGNTVSTRRKVTGRAYHRPCHTSGGEVSGFIEDSTYELNSYVREINLSRPTHPLYLGLPTSDIPKLVDSLAMIWQSVVSKAIKFKRG